MKTVPHKPATFKLATRWGVIVNGELIDVFPNQDLARVFARVMYADKKTYENAVRKKEIAVLKVDIRPAKAKK